MWFLRNLFRAERNDLESLIERKLEEGVLSEHRLPFINKLNTLMDFKFYKTDESNKQFWVEETKQLKHINVYVGFKIIIFFRESSLITIVFDWKGLKELVKIFEDGPMFDDDASKRKLFITKYDLDNYLKNLDKNYEDVLRAFPEIVIHDDVIVLFKTIIPEYAIIDRYTKVKIPEGQAIPIARITIYTDPSGLISSVKIIGKHPNADNSGWFCLGDLKMIPLSVSAINQIITQIKCYKLYDCYWRPKNYKDWK